MIDMLKHLLLLLIWSLYCEARVIDLGKNVWRVTNSNKSINIGAQVPGGIYSDLRQAKILNSSILYRFNDVEYRWVGKENWTYFTEFSLSESDMESKYIHLILHGVDTFGKVFLNGKCIGEVENMFVQYSFQIKNQCVTGMNLLRLELLSPIAEAKSRAAKLPYKIPLECWPDQYNGECQINKIRKMQSSFGWDWGPAMPSVGIWKPIEVLISNTSLTLRSVGLVTLDRGPDWHVVVRAWFEASDPNAKNFPGGLLTVSIFLDETITLRKRVIPSLVDGHIEARLSLKIPKSKTELWWPNGYGRQKLYICSLAYKSENEVASKTFEFGFRSVKLVQSPVSEDKEQGLTFYFMVNNIPIFAKGSNWIPLHVLPELSSDMKRVKNLLQDAKDANFNMLRVWGGGLYESDYFYSMCDKLGIMLWHDLMFACNMYPTDNEFLSSVSKEIEQQIKRLQHHPSIVIWAGNNENEAALSGDWYGTGKDFEQYKLDYIKLYVETIKPIVKFIDPTRPYVTSSPSNGLETEAEGFVAKSPQSTLYGDVHYYNYLANGWDWMIYPKTRFASEYGIQSLPSLSTLAEAALPSDLTLNSKFFEHRQHLAGGYDFMKLLIQKNLPLSNDTDTFIYLSQINQAMSMKTETETYRAMKSKLFDSGEGLTMGALYWQLNDVWQAPSWSSIDFAGRWKMLHYYAKDFFAPIIVVASLKADKQLIVTVVSDLTTAIPSAYLEMDVYSFVKGFAPVETHRYSISVPSNSSLEVLNQNVNNFFKKCKKNECFIKFHLKKENGEEIAPENFLFLSPLYKMSFQEANVQVVQVTQKERNKVELVIESDCIALFVWIEAPDFKGRFSENGFMMADSLKHVSFETQDGDLNATKFQSNVRIRSLNPRY